MGTSKAESDLSSFLLWAKVLEVTSRTREGSMQSGGKVWLGRAELAAANITEPVSNGQSV